MRTGTRHVCWVSVDTYDAEGRLIFSTLGARSLESGDDTTTVLITILDHFPPGYRQMSYQEVLEALASPERPERVTWDQLSIF